MKRISKAPGVRLADQMQAFSFLEHVAASLNKQPTFDQDSFFSDLRVELSRANRKESFEQLTQYLARQLGVADTKSQSHVGITHVELKHERNVPETNVKDVESESPVLTT